MGSTGAGGDQHAFTIALNSLLGTRLKPIAGYPGTQEIMLAIERGELDGIVGYSWGVARAGNRDDMRPADSRSSCSSACKSTKSCPMCRCSTNSCTMPHDREVLDMIFSRQAMGRPLVAPPGLDPRCCGTSLRAGLCRGDARSQLIAEAAKMDLELGFAGGDEVQAMVERLYQSPPEVIARAQAIAAGN